MSNDTDEITCPELPMPGETFDGKIVVASCWSNIDYDGGENEDLMLADLLLLDPKHPSVSAEPQPNKGFYSVVQIVARVEDGDEWGEIIDLEPDFDIHNIVHAAEWYRQMTGCV